MATGRAAALAGRAVSPYGGPTSSEPRLGLRVTRLENDGESLYDLLTDVNRTVASHTRRFDGIDRRFDGIDRRFDGMDQRLDGMDQRLDGMDQRFDSVTAAWAEVLRRLPEPS